MKLEFSEKVTKPRPPWHYYITPSRIKAWWLGVRTKRALKVIQENTLDIDPATYGEQYVYRQTRCECFEIGYCKCCNCPAEEKMMQADEECKWGLWGKMMQRVQWRIFKKQKGIKFKA